jgi:hypothetical protein
MANWSLNDGALSLSTGTYLERWRMRRRRSLRRFMRFLCHLGRIPPGRLTVPIPTRFFSGGEQKEEQNRIEGENFSVLSKVGRQAVSELFD